MRCPPSCKWGASWLISLLSFAKIVYEEGFFVFLSETKTSHRSCYVNLFNLLFNCLGTYLIFQSFFIFDSSRVSTLRHVLSILILGGVRTDRLMDGGMGC